ncbi:MAG TPA: hybrid sensor histidine kinase/response regulator [Gemmatimonadales bacterium]|nr:hybrid sensor histidine kinase/response regulator [Gemmatimonadales bacterium]
MLGFILGALAGAILTAIWLLRRASTSGSPSPAPGSPLPAPGDQNERLADAGRRLAEVVHELNNPLTAVLAFAQDLLRADPSAEQREALLVIQQQARRSRKLVRGLLDEVRAVPRVVERIDSEAVIARVLPIFQREAERHGIHFVNTVDRNLPSVDGDTAGLEQVLTNLLQNAFQATPRGGTVSLTTRVRGRLLEFVVQDNGPGIPPGHLDRIFEPFFTTKGAGEGTGLGLSVSQTIIRRHRGTLVGENVPDWEGGGARFIVALPFLERRRIDRDLMEDDFDSEPAPGGEGRTALLIEDDHAVRLSIRRYLERFGWHVEEAGDGTAGALRVLAEEWDLVICDLRVPGRSGLEIYDQVASANPGLAKRFVLITGDAGTNEVRAFRERTGLVILEKPFELRILGAAIQRTASPAPE